MLHGPDVLTPRRSDDQLVPEAGDDLRRALVRDALRPLTSDRTVRRLVRALCDHDTWRALRRQRIGAEEAVDTAAELIAARLRAT